MAKMTAHEFLINTIASTVLNIIPYPFSPIAPSGILGNKFGYVLKLAEFGDTINALLKKKGAKVPDLILINMKKKILITVECKSDFTFEIEEKLTKQLDFYSSEIFKKICKEMFPNLTKHEIWLFAPEDFCEQITSFVRNLIERKKLTNIVVWGVKLKKRREEAHIKKFFGNHIDPELNQKMKDDGLVCSPPRFELLIDPTLSYGKRVSRIGRRILTFLASLYVSDKDRIVTLEDFKKKHTDVIMTNKELKKCLRYLSKLVPEIGTFNSTTGELTLAKRPSLDKVKNKLLTIQEMSDEDIKIELARMSKAGVRGFKRPKDSQKTKISKWFPKRNVNQSYTPWIFPNSLNENLIFTLPFDDFNPFKEN
jgi:hypothetical protein